ncbi:carbohydrate sulfotransferase 11-like [Oratosquilla oratoria]
MKHGNFVWDQKHNLVYCQIYKSASTTWIYNFLLLGHYREDEPELQGLSRIELDAIRFKEWNNHEFNYRLEVYRLFPPPATSRLLNDAFRKAVRFIIVRHPFARLLSAYRDKIEPLESWPAEFNFRQLGQEIIRVYRPREENITSPTPTFPEFVQYVIDSTANLTTAHEWKKKVVCWTPYWVLCGVCSSDYQLILKLETMHEDEHFLITLANLEEIKERQEWLHGASGGDSLKKSFKYFRHVTQKQMFLLRERYALDFELFDYNIEEFLEVAKDAPVVG